MSAILAVLLAGGLQADELTIRAATDRPEPVYEVAAPITFRVEALEGDNPAAGKNLRWKRTGDDGLTETGKAKTSGTETVLIGTTMDRPGFVRLEVWAEDDQGKPLTGAKGQPIRFDGGAAVAPGQLSQAVAEPADFDAFWSAQLARLKDVPLKASLTEVPSEDAGFVVYDVRIDCAGGRPVSGYLTLPKDAAPKSLKATATYMGYGITSAKPYKAPGTLTLSINAHGIENGREAEYYKGLGLEKYGFNAAENARPETSYFLGMMLRVARSLEFLKSRPEWNGKDLIVSGGSQGGFQAIAGAALDRDVTRCFAQVPWFCDLGGPKAGRLPGWRPEDAAGLGYFDTVNFARRVTCAVSLGAGLGDYVCPPSGVTVLYHNLAGPKKLEFIQGRTHQFTPRDTQKIAWESRTPTLPEPSP